MPLALPLHDQCRHPRRLHWRSRWHSTQKSSPDRAFAALAAGIALAVSVGSARAEAPAPQTPRFEALSRGLVHEGFVAPIAFDPAPGFVAPQGPPAPLDEQPPALRPSGSRAIWLPGYWTWDGQRGGFVWTSGGWRLAPPGMRWIPGYWDKTSGGFQWASGFWAPAAAGSIPYLSLPLKTKREATGAGALAPADISRKNQFWVPGYWQARGGDFVWQGGFWTPAKPGWIWTPAHYVWTPAGAVLVAGYWDYPLARRGLLFAPAAVETVAGAQGGVSYVPQAAVNLRALASNILVSTANHQCCFGEYDSDSAAKQAVETRSAFEARGAGLVPIEAAVGGQPPAAEPLVVALSDLSKTKVTLLALVETDRSARRRAARAVEDALEIVARRRKFEGAAEKPLDVTGLAYVRTLPLPKLAPELGGPSESEIPASAAQLDQLPGIDDRRTPGTKARDVPGLGGRVVPGVRDPLPGIGPLPGADNQR